MDYVSLSLSSIDPTLEHHVSLERASSLGRPVRQDDIDEVRSAKHDFVGRDAEIAQHLW